MRVIGALRVGMRACVLSLTWCLLGVTGCATSTPNPTYQTLSDQVSQRSEAAKKANEQGLLYAQNNELEKAEASFREALQADIGHAAAHNNLGLVLFSNNKFYEAAMEFRFASKLNPHAIEPVMNLARLYETVGWKKEAEREYARAVRLGKDAGDPEQRYVRRSNKPPTSAPPDAAQKAGGRSGGAAPLPHGEKE
jgi:Tfp pilus assembly protein PilF